MLGDMADMARRMLAVLPTGWFSGTASVLHAILCGCGTAWASVMDLIVFARAQTRIHTATGGFLDLIADDFFGICLNRWPGETDSAFRARIQANLLLTRGTRSAVAAALYALTGFEPAIFEPARATDTGGYNVGGVGYGLAGGWGNLNLPYQAFVTLQRPGGGGIAELAGYGTAGALALGDVDMEPASLSDAALYAAIPPLLPIGITAWARLID